MALKLKHFVEVHFTLKRRSLFGDLAFSVYHELQELLVAS